MKKLEFYCEFLSHLHQNEICSSLVRSKQFDKGDGNGDLSLYIAAAYILCNVHLTKWFFWTKQMFQLFKIFCISCDAVDLFVLWQTKWMRIFFVIRCSKRWVFIYRIEKQSTEWISKKNICLSDTTCISNIICDETTFDHCIRDNYRSIRSLKHSFKLI